MLDKAKQAHHNKINRKYSKKYKLSYRTVGVIRILAILENKTKDEIIKKFQEKIKNEEIIISQLRKANKHRAEAIEFLNSCKDFEYEDLIKKIVQAVPER